MASPLTKLNALARLKVVKDHILHQLDTVISLLGILERRSNSSLENENSLLQASIHLVEALQQQVQSQRQQQNQILRQIEVLQQQSQNQTLQQVGTLQQQLGTLQQQVEQQLGTLQQQVKQQLDPLQQQSQLHYQTLQQIEVLQQQQNQILQQIEALNQQRGVIVTTEQYSLLNPEISLMAYLYSYLPNRTALDIGANTGEVSERLLQSGYEVYAFEPFPPVFDELRNRLGKYVGFHPYKLALGSSDGTMDLHVATDLSDSNKYQDSTLFNSLTPHSMLEDLKFTSTVPVPVRSLESLHKSLEIPDSIGLVKVDTEGFELEVVRGMGEYRYPVVMTEFWDSKTAFGQSKALNKLEEQVKEMRQRNYHWHIVIYRIWGGSNGAAFYSNHPQSVDNSWGNVFFFQDYNVFAQALKWCSAAIPVTYFNS